MDQINNAGFNGSFFIQDVKIVFRHGSSIDKLKDNMDKQPYDHFFWIKDEKMFLYRNKEGEFFELEFKKIEL